MVYNIEFALRPTVICLSIFGNLGLKRTLKGISLNFHTVLRQKFVHRDEVKVSINPEMFKQQ